MPVLLYPYLPLSARTKIGDWELIPSGKLKEEDVAPGLSAGLVEKLAGLYEVPEGLSRPGAFAREDGRRVGEDFDDDGMRRLGRALTLAVVAPNPEPGLVSGDRGNAGHSAMTSDNAIGYGHPLAADGGVAVEYGAMVRTLVGGLNVDSGDHRIVRPPEVTVPILPLGPDPEIADSVYRVLSTDSEEIHRVATTIDWLGLSWRNSVSLNADLRIFALKTGFEVLIDTSEAFALARELSALLDDPVCERELRTWHTRAGKPETGEKSALEWWLIKFCFLRNAIAHGEDPEVADYLFEGLSHIELGQARLCDAILRKVADAGFPDVLIERGERAIRAAYRKAGIDPDGAPPGQQLGNG